MTTANGGETPLLAVAVAERVFREKLGGQRRHS